MRMGVNRADPTGVQHLASEGYNRRPGPPLVDNESRFHALDVPAVISAIESSEDGLRDIEARRRLESNGPNALTTRGGPTWPRKLAEQFIQPLVVVLIGAAVLSLVLRDYVDACVIAGVVVLNALIGFLQEYRAEQAIAALARLVVTEATVVRDGVARRVPSEQLVIGDVVLIQSGDTVPADLRLVSAKGLRVEEAALTGESLPVDKSPERLPLETPLGDRRNLAFAGAQVTSGQARGIVVATGDRTETGRIAGLMASTKQLETPLLGRIARLSQQLVWIILAIAAILFLVEALRGSPLRATFNAAVALAVGAIPEGLPAAVTILLAVGVSAMARRNALIRRLPAVETLGSTTVICSDKTGTLTENQMTVTAVLIGDSEYEVTGVGFDVAGEVRHDGAVITGTEHAVGECLRAGALCNDARLTNRASGVTIEGDPTEAALLVAARKIGIDELALAAWPRRDVVPFESQHMYMATLHESSDRECVMYVKGSSDALLDRCVDELREDGTVSSIDRSAVHAAVRRLAARGLRVLVVARRRFLDQRTISHESVGQLTLVGLVAMIDPPRPEAKRAVAACSRAGVKVKMITGDHAVTATAIAAELGLEGLREDDGRLRAMTGTELASIPPELLPEIADDVAVFARVAPEQKLALVRALRQRGHVVAMTGDGVNDAPALKQADIGVAMGRGGTDVARSASAMVLTDDNFATIAAAVEEGRAVYDNLVKFIAWTLPTNGGSATVLLAGVLFGALLPVLPVQLLWMNMATAVLLGTALVFEPREPGLMSRPPRKVDAPLVDVGLAVRTAVVSIAMGASAFVLFTWARDRGLSDAQARTIAVNTIVVIEVGYLFACRSLRLPLSQIGLFTNRWVFVGALFMLLAQLAFTYVPAMNRLFHSAPIDAWWWGVMSAIGATVFVIAELQKYFSTDAVDGGVTCKRTKS